VVEGKNSSEDYVDFAIHTWGLTVDILENLWGWSGTRG
jgi:hypothetical protein